MKMERWTFRSMWYWWLPSQWRATTSSGRTVEETAPAGSALPLYPAIPAPSPCFPLALIFPPRQQGRKISGPGLQLLFH